MRKYLATTALATLLSLGGCARQHTAPMTVANTEQTTMSDTGTTPEYATAQLADGAYVTSVANRYYARRTYRRGYYSHPRYVVHRRSGRKSAAIIGGSAAGGALIGGLAGGGKGAAIGALVGGGGGLAYDRATHKKVRAY